MAAKQSETSARWRAQPRFCVLPEHQRPLGPPRSDRQRPAIARPGRVSGPPDPHVRIDLRVAGVGRRKRAEATLERVAPNVESPQLPPDAGPHVYGTAA